MTPFHQLGLAPQQASSAAGPGMPGVARSGGPGLSDTTSPWHPDSALFWFAVFLGATVGLIAGSTQLRLGPFKASAGVGSSK